MKTIRKTSDNKARRLKTNNGFIVLDLHGSWYQMGQQYGQLLKTELHALAAKLIPYMTPDIIAAAALIRASEPIIMRNIVRGVGIGANLTETEMTALETMEFIAGNIPACSTIALWGDATENHQTILGRNYDWYMSVEKIQPPLITAIWHPAIDEGAQPVATIAWAGIIYATTAINAAGICIELNAELISQTPPKFDQRVFSPGYLLEAAATCKTIDETTTALRKHKPFLPHIIGIADKQSACLLEWGTTRAKIVRPTDNHISATNHFQQSNKNATPATDDGNPFASCRRLTFIQNRIARRAAPFTARDICDILSGDIATANGVAFATDKFIRTCYQVVMLPQTRQLILRDTICAIEWETIPLAALLAE